MRLAILSVQCNKVKKEWDMTQKFVPPGILMTFVELDINKLFSISPLSVRSQKTEVRSRSWLPSSGF
jgi:hypothetical protein